MSDTRPEWRVQVGLPVVEPFAKVFLQTFLNLLAAAAEQCAAATKEAEDL